MKIYKITEAIQSVMNTSIESARTIAAGLADWEAERVKKIIVNIREENKQLLEAPQALYNVQYRLTRDVSEWEEAMRMAKEALREDD
jgi:hypothetical protein